MEAEHGREVTQIRLRGMRAQHERAGRKARPSMTTRSPDCLHLGEEIEIAADRAAAARQDADIGASRQDRVRG